MKPGDLIEITAAGYDYTVTGTVEEIHNDGMIGIMVIHSDRPFVKPDTRVNVVNTDIVMEVFDND
jgi:hypothetical protein